MASLSIEEASALQRDLAARVVREDRVGAVTRVTGVDAAYTPDDRHVIAAAVMLDVATLRPVDSAIAVVDGTFPYVPGLFSFRELPAIAAALDRLADRPQLIVCDGHGVAHPRRLGLASHLGVTRGIATIGCAKTRLTGRHEPLAAGRGAWVPLIDEGETIGAVVRTQDNVRPVYVSIGSMVSLPTACAWVLKLSHTYRLPETTRAADHAVRQALKKFSADALNESMETGEEKEK